MADDMDDTERLLEAIRKAEDSPRDADNRGYVERLRWGEEARAAFLAECEAQMEALRASGPVCSDHPYETQIDDDGSRCCGALGCKWHDGKYPGEDGYEWPYWRTQWAKSALNGR